jgi:L-lactate dehydrogenase complex protein LldG
VSQGARDLILDRVRAAIGPSQLTATEFERGYQTQTDAGVEVLIERLHDYGARTRLVPAAELAAGVSATLVSEGVQRVVVPDGIPDTWVAGLELLRDSPALDPEALERADGVVSTCAVAIAQTGTLVFDGSAGMGRRILSLIPDRLVCVVRPDQIVGSLPEAIARLDATRPLTFVSGPSATVDIEMVRVVGVHGPRQLAVVLVS